MKKLLNKRRGQVPGFTLLELLIVIAIIGILAAMLFPVLGMTKLKAMQLQCANNLKELGIANTIYMADFHGKCLPYQGRAGLWMAALVDYYAKVDAVRLCPVAAETNSPDGWGRADKAWHRTGWGNSSIWTGSYGMNGWLFSDLTNLPPEDEANMFHQESGISKASETPLFTDCVWDDLWPRTNDPPAINLYKGYRGSGTDGKIGRITIPRHSFPAARAPIYFDPEQRLPGAINVGCFDGHVQTSKLENLWNYYWNKSWDPPHPRPD